MAEGWDTGTKETVRKIPLLQVREVPMQKVNHDSCAGCHAERRLHAGAGWASRQGAVDAAVERGAVHALSHRHQPHSAITLHDTSAAVLEQELQALIKYIQLNKASDSDWFTITSNKEGTLWSGKCWYVHELIKYEFDFEFDIPATYPVTAPEIRIPSLDGKTAKMYRGGAICLTVHFKPLWAKNRWDAVPAPCHADSTAGMDNSMSHSCQGRVTAALACRLAGPFMVAGCTCFHASR